MKLLHFVCLLLILPFSPFILKGQDFTDVAGNAGISHLFGHNGASMGGGVAVFDFDNDGWEDLFITGGNGGDKLYQNNRDGSFTDISAAAGLSITGPLNTIGVIAGDIDNDGFKDLFITVWARHNDFFTPNDLPNLLLRNNGNGTFSDISADAGIADSSWSVSATFGDINLDGFLDIYVVNYLQAVSAIYNSQGNVISYIFDCAPNFLYLNNGDGTFTESAAAFGVQDLGCGLACTFTDIDNDQDPDLYVSNDFGHYNIPSTIYRNEYPLPFFTDAGQATGMHSSIFGMGVAIGDYNEDGLSDYYETNIGRNILYRQESTNVFTDVSDSSLTDCTYAPADTSGTFLSTSWSCNFLDYDNDSYLDLFVSNGQVPTSPPIPPTHPIDPNKLYKNLTNGTFADVSTQAGVDRHHVSRGSAIGDLNKDGLMEILSVETTLPGIPLDPLDLPGFCLFRNDLTQANHWLKVSLEGVIQNRDAIGAKVIVKASGRTFIREIDGGSGFASHNSTIAHFGLGNIQLIDTLEVNWPGGKSQLLTAVAVDQEIHVTEQVDCLADASEPNDQSSSAVNLYGGAMGGMAKTRICPPYDQDWFYFQTTMPSTDIRLRLEDLPADFDLELYDAAGNLLGDSKSPGLSDEEIFLTNATASTWIVKVFGKDRAWHASEAYSLIVQTQKAAPTGWQGVKDPLGQGVFKGTDVEEEIAVYPNPAEDMVLIEFPGSLEAHMHIQLIDLAGKSVFNKKLNPLDLAGYAHIDISRIPKGMYVLQVRINERSFHKRLTISR